MGEVRIHRSRPGGEFVQLPNVTVHDESLTWAARGYLADILAHKPDWEPETAPQAAARAKRKRPGIAEPRNRVKAIFRELERHGYRHRVLRRDTGGLFVTEAHYYDRPARPCLDALTCVCCREGGTK